MAKDVGASVNMASEGVDINASADDRRIAVTRTTTCTKCGRVVMPDHVNAEGICVLCAPQESGSSEGEEGR